MGPARETSHCGGCATANQGHFLSDGHPCRPAVRERDLEHLRFNAEMSHGVSNQSSMEDGRGGTSQERSHYWDLGIPSMLDGFEGDQALPEVNRAADLLLLKGKGERSFGG